MDHESPYPRKRVRMKCAFGHLSVAAAAPDGYQIDADNRGRAERFDGGAAMRVQPQHQTSEEVSRQERTEITVRRRSRLASLASAA